MNWINIHTDTLREVAFVGADPEERATWLCLLGWCVSQENGGIIEDAESWSDRKWQQLCAVTKDEVETTCLLYGFEDGNLVLQFYPIEQEIKVVKNRANGSKGGRPKRKDKSESIDTQDEKPHGLPDGSETLKRNSNSNSNSKEKNIHQQTDKDSIFPKGSLSKSIYEQKRTKVLRNMPMMVRISKWFNRREDTLWTVSEANALRQIKPSNDDIDVLERYYSNRSEDKPLRMSIDTLLNNWSGEMDRANNYRPTKSTSNQPFKSV